MAVNKKGNVGYKTINNTKEENYLIEGCKKNYLQVDSMQAFRAHFDRVGQRILRALASPSNSMTAIAHRHRVSEAAVKKVKEYYGLRPRGLAREIGARVTALKKKGLRRKVFYFTAKEKKGLLKQHNRALAKVALKGWAAKPIRRRYMFEFDHFFEDLKNYVFKQLDYYNPNVEGTKGKTASPLTWIVNGANIFYYDSYRRASRSKERAMPADQNGLPIAQTGMVRATAEARLKPAIGLQWVSFSTGALLKKLGLNPKKVARLGFGGIKKQIIEISKSTETGLTKTEKKIIKMRLDGKRLRWIAPSLGMTPQNVSRIETNAAKKIRWQIKKMSLQELVKETD